VKGINNGFVTIPFISILVMGFTLTHMGHKPYKTSHFGKRRARKHALRDPNQSNNAKLELDHAKNMTFIYLATFK
jgi:hypothetical protein